MKAAESMFVILDTNHFQELVRATAPGQRHQERIAMVRQGAGMQLAERFLAAFPVKHKIPGMSTVAQLEASIEHLTSGDFLDLMEWMTDRHLQRLAGEGFESAEMEAAMLQGLEGPRHEVDDSFFNSIRAGWKESAPA